METNSDLYFASVTAVLDAVSCYLGHHMIVCIRHLARIGFKSFWSLFLVHSSPCRCPIACTVSTSVKANGNN